ncbi:MAG: OPT/YSL family transporter [Myxococcales bacterium]|nr:OPT/YSL family transporter [Myxococcales bacterium]
MSEPSPPAPVVPASMPELTLRSVLTGMLIGGVLSTCNIYAGLKIGWGMNMSVTASLLGFALWKALQVTGTREFSILECNLNQTTASSAAAVSSAGLVAPIPALTIMTGYQYTWQILAGWTLSVMLVGIVAGIGLRRQLIVVDKLPFPGGLAAAETLKQMYAVGKEAMARVKMLGLGAVLAASAALTIELAKIQKWAPALGWAAPAPVAAKGITKVSLTNLGFALDPSPLMAAVGVLVGIRASTSLFLGSLIAYGILGPYALSQGWVLPSPKLADKSWYTPLLSWLLWPGVSMMVTSSLASLAFSWRSMLRAFMPGSKGKASDDDELPADSRLRDVVPMKWFLGALVVVAIFATITQVSLFSIAWWTAILGVLLTFVLAIVTGRVTGETNVTPVGAMGKVTQLVFGIIQPGNVAANLMSANVTGGAASQAGDLLHDLKAGLILGASPRRQAIAQAFGALSGALIGSAAYLVLVRDAKTMLLTDQWPAPAVASWKAVAELFAKGLSAMPPGALAAIWIGGGVGILLAVLEKKLPVAARKWVPSPSSMGLGFVIPAYQGFSMLLGAVLALIVQKRAPTWAERFLIVLASGFIAGESLTGVGIALHKMLGG